MLLSMILQLLSGIYYFALHVTGAGSFPPPLSSKQESELLAKAENGVMSTTKSFYEVE